MKWLIVEDALKDRKGHWAEYVETFRVGLASLGDEVTILADRDAEDFITQGMHAKPVLPPSIWHRMSDGSSRLRRYGRVPYHAWKTVQAMKRWLRSNSTPDLIFVPTVLVHHLLAWYWMIQRRIVARESRLLLFFPNLPLQLSEDGQAVWTGGPTTRLMSYLFRKLQPWVEQKKVIIAVETHAMRVALMQLTRLPVVYLPHPVQFKAVESTQHKHNLTFACYGAARQEKGSDVLQLAFARFLEKNPGTDVEFVIQWVDDFVNTAGELVRPLKSLMDSRHVRFIRRYFYEGEYSEQLAQTDVMVLPYERHAYHVRVSRVVIEAMIQGLPVITTAHTTMSDQLRQFGAEVTFPEGDVDGLVSAIEQAMTSICHLRERALSRQHDAQRHFSVSCFREFLMGQLVHN